MLSVAGVFGLILGSGLSLKFRERFPRIDPIICGVGLIVSAPFLFVGIGLAKDGIVMAFILVFVGQIFLNANWAVVVDIALVNDP